MTAYTKLMRNHRGRGRWIRSLVLLCGWLFAGVVCGDEIANFATVEHLLDQARQAEVTGDTARQFSLLREAVRIAPDSQLARWQLGQLKVGENWLSVEDAERIAAANPKQEEYRQLRAQYGEGLDGQLALARWCRKNDLDEEARFHWASVLGVQPGNEEALRAMDMRLYDGRPMTAAQIAAAKQFVRDAKRAVEVWGPKVSKWRRTFERSDSTARGATLDEIRAVRDTDAIPAIEAVTLWSDATDKKKAGECLQIGLAFMDALKAISAPSATLSLARHAVVAPSETVRTAAIAKLKERPLYEFVPALLDALDMPVESSYYMARNADGSVHYYHSLYREEQNANWSADLVRSVTLPDFAGNRYYLDRSGQLTVAPPRESSIETNIKRARVAANYERRFAGSVATTESRVAQENEVTEARNALIVRVLEGTTGKEFGNAPKAWWGWWREQNEYYSGGDEPTYAYRDSRTDNRVYRQPEIYPARFGGRGSCFAKGTPVWTKTGQQPIETLTLGDLVLAQDVHTGELAYKPVIGRTVRPPTTILNLRLGSEEILTTRGHPFWVAGVGWRMAKELGDGAVLHGVTGSLRLTAIVETEEAEAYNLVVADFNTYFVGKTGILVHDNTPRLPTRATVPGLAATK